MWRALTLRAGCHITWNCHEHEVLAGRECWMLVTTPRPLTTELKLNLQSASPVLPSLGTTAPVSPTSTNLTLTSSWNPARENGEAEGEA